MQTIKSGSIKKLYIAEKTSTGESTIVILKDAVIQKDAEFYTEGSKIISFDYNTQLATLDEATLYLTENIPNNNDDNNNRECLFVDYDSLESTLVTEKKFSQLQRSYKQKRKTR